MSDSKAQSPTPPLHAEVRAAVAVALRKLVVKAQEEAMTNIENHTMLSEAENTICQAVADALLAAAQAEKRQLIEPVTKRVVTDGDKVGIDLDADTKGSLVFIQDNGFNQGVDAVTRVIGEVLG